MRGIDLVLPNKIGRTVGPGRPCLSPYGSERYSEMAERVRYIPSVSRHASCGLRTYCDPRLFCFSRDEGTTDLCRTDTVRKPKEKRKSKRKKHKVKT